jgi:hypothetical protein
MRPRWLEWEHELIGRIIETGMPVESQPSLSGLVAMGPNPSQHGSRKTLEPCWAIFGVPPGLKRGRRGRADPALRAGLNSSASLWHLLPSRDLLFRDPNSSQHGFEKGHSKPCWAIFGRPSGTCCPFGTSRGEVGIEGAALLWVEWGGGVKSGGPPAAGRLAPALQRLLSGKVVERLLY